MTRGPEARNPSTRSASPHAHYARAQAEFAAWDVDVEAALAALQTISLSLPCWQGDDVRGFESPDRSLGGGLAVTGNRPGRARNAHELRDDLAKALQYIPGRHRINLHAIYADPSNAGPFERHHMGPAQFAAWQAWGQTLGVSFDFNPTFFAHPWAESGRTLTHPEHAVRQFWIQHAMACRQIGASFGQSQGNPCVTNIWIPDGAKDNPIDRAGPRHLLLEALDTILAEPLPTAYHRDAVEAKLFGLGSESYVVGSHEFYLGYAITRQVLLCLDTGHFHPTEGIADKISAILPYVPGLLLHFSRGVRWDSDHVVTLSDDLLAIAQEIVRGDYLPRVHIGLDFFDATIHRVAGWVIAARNVQKAFLMALLEPRAKLRDAEQTDDTTCRLALLEELKSFPWQAVWNEFCQRNDVPVGPAWMAELARYEQQTLTARGM